MSIELDNLNAKVALLTSSISNLSQVVDAKIAALQAVPSPVPPVATAADLVATTAAVDSLAAVVANEAAKVAAIPVPA